MIRLLVALALLTPATARADCYTQRRGAGSGQYALKDGIAYDPRTNLSWKRCGFDRRWTGVACDGEAKRVTFDKARAAAEAAGDGWRLPTIQELASLIDRSCGAPAIDKVAFPDIAPNDEGKASYWSSSPAPDIPGMFYIVDFSDGDVDMHSTGIWLNLRLVRTGR